MTPDTKNDTKTFGTHGNNGSFSFPLFPQSPENSVKSDYLEASEIMEIYPDLLLINRCDQWEHIQFESGRGAK